MKKREIKAVLKQLDTIPLPDKEKILSACPKQPVATETPYRPVRHRKLRLSPVLAAIIAALVLASGFSTYAIAIDIREYNDAVSFFREYNLSVEDLSRNDIKKVYRDIITGSFTYGKTVEVFKKSVSGYELFQDEPTPEDLENLWVYIKDEHFFVNSKLKDENGVYYKFDYDKRIFEKYVDEKLTWSVDFTDFYIEGYEHLGSSVIVYGRRLYNTSPFIYTYIAMIDQNGNVLWKKYMEHGFSIFERIGAVLPDNDEIYVFSHGDNKYMCLTKFDLKGNLISYRKTEIGNYGVTDAARWGDGYIVQLWTNNLPGKFSKFVKVDSDGAILETLEYTSDDETYFIRDMIEYNSNIYLSAYSVPVQENKNNYAGGRYEIADILNYIFDNSLYDIPNEELTKLVRENYTAVLLVCSPDSGQPQTFFTAKGSRGGRLAISSDGKLLWDVESITDTFFSIATSSFTIGGYSYIYRYTFDEGGALISQEKTKEIADYRR